MVLLILSSLGRLGPRPQRLWGSVRDPRCAPLLSAAGEPSNRPPRRTTTPQLSQGLWHLECLVSTGADRGPHHVQRRRDAGPELEGHRALRDQDVEAVED